MSNIAHTPKASSFVSSPLVTPERIVKDHHEAFSARPEWLRSVHFEAAECSSAIGHVNEPQPIAVITLGKSRVFHKHLSLLGLAVAFEATRLPGVSMFTNGNGKKPERFYMRLSFSGHSADLTTFSRILSGSGSGEEITTDIFQHDLRPEYLTTRPVSKGNKDAREVVLSHLDRIAHKMEAEGDFASMPFSAHDYMANLKSLLHAVDSEAEGIDLFHQYRETLSIFAHGGTN